MDGRDGKAADVRGTPEVDLFLICRVITYTIGIQAICLDTGVVMEIKKCR